MLERAARSVGRFLFTDAPPNSGNPMHMLTGKMLKPRIGVAVSLGFLGHAAVTSHLADIRQEKMGLQMGIMPLPRYAADGQMNMPGSPFYGREYRDLTLGATGDIVFGLRELTRRF